MEVIFSSETSVHIRTIWCNIPEDNIQIVLVYSRYLYEAMVSRAIRMRGEEPLAEQVVNQRSGGLRAARK
jgi:hypothetical protein